jgi:hypothetical protein
MGALWGLCERFIRENEIQCAESVYQMDGIAENSLELIERICEIVGYRTTGSPDKPNQAASEDAA